MYETRLVGGGGKSSGLGGAPRGPVDLLLNGLVGVLIVYLAWTVVEPFWAGAMEQSRDVRLQADMKVLTDALGRYKVQRGEYEDEDLKNLAAYLSNIPEDPWGQPYSIDPLFRRILSGGEDRILGATPEAKESLDDHVHYFQRPGRLRVVVEQAGATVPFEMTMDGTEARPVAGQYLRGVRRIAEGGVPASLVYAAMGSDGSLDVARQVPGEAASNWLVGGPGDDDQPAVASGVGFAYFRGLRGGGHPLVYRVPLAGGPPEKVTEAPDKWDFPEWDGDHGPAVAPESGHLAFHAARIAGSREPRICFVAKGNPLGPVRILKDPFPAGADAQWGPDGKTLFYRSADGRRLVRIPFPPSRQEEVLSFSQPIQGYAVSPDAEFVASYDHGAEGAVTVTKVSRKAGRVVFQGQGRVVAVSWIP